MEAVTAEEETAGVGAMPAAAIRAVRMPAPVPMLEPARTQAQAPRLLMPVLPLMRVLRPAGLAGGSPRGAAAPHLADRGAGHVRGGAGGAGRWGGRRRR